MRRRLFFFLFALLGITVPGYAIVYVVPGGAGAQDGTSWVNAYASIQAAINAGPGVEVWVAAGTYAEPTITWQSNVSVYGGFTPGMTARDQRNFTANQTILDGQHARRITHIAGVENIRFDGFILQNGNGSYPASSDGWAGAMFTEMAGPGIVANCIFRDNTCPAHGGALNINPGGLTVENCSFQDNTASQFGGGVMVHWTLGVSFTNCTFTGNAASPYGGGVSVWCSESTFTNCAFSGNSAGEGAGLWLLAAASPGSPRNFVLSDCQFTANVSSSEGGGLMMQVQESTTGNLVMTNCSFSSNQAANTGGGAFLRGANWGGAGDEGHATVQMTDTSFTGNITSAASGAGAYIESRETGATMDATLLRCTFNGNMGQGPSNGSNGSGVSWIRTGGSMTDCTFINNTSTNVAGGLWIDNTAGGPSVSLDRCLFQGNHANMHGGAIWSATYANTTITNSRFVQNIADSGGGAIFNIAYSAMNLTNCLFDRNQAVGWICGGLVTWDHSNTTVRNCTFGGNTGGGSGALFNGSGDLDNSVLTVVNSICYGDTAPEIVAQAPATASVTYSDIQGGFTGTGNTSGNPNFINAAGGDLRINTGSAALDTATSSGAPATDILGTPRPQGAGYDMGTYERDTTPPTIGIGSPSLAATNIGPVSFTITYGEAAAVTLAPANVTLNKTGTANAATIQVSGTGTATRTVTLSGITGDGTLGISIAAASATDAAGNPAPAAGPSSTFTVDNTPPTIIVGNPTPSVTRTGPVTYTVTYTDAANITLNESKITLNGPPGGGGAVAVSGSSSTRTVTISSITGDGSCSISIAAGTAVDTLGNASGAAGSTPFTVDNTPPNPPVVTGTTPTSNQRPTWTWTPGGGGNGTYRYDLDSSGAWTNTTATAYTPVSNLAAGSHHLAVQARDAAGNWSVDGFFDILIDLTPPNPVVVNGITPTNDQTPTWSWSSGGGDGNGTFRYQLDSTSGTWTTTTGTSYTPGTNLPEGSHQLHVQERDAVGNWSADSFFDIFVDITPPNPPIVTGTTPTNDQTPTWSWTAGGGGDGTYRWDLDSSGSWTEIIGTAYTPTADLTPGSHRLTVQARDAAGNWSVDSFFDIFIDITIPSPPSVTGPAVTNNPRPTWTWTPGGGGSGTYRYQLESTSGSWAITTHTSYTPAINLRGGSHRLYVQERDPAGNWSAEGFFDILVDLTPPSPPVINGTTPTSNPRPTWTWTSGGGGNGTFRWDFEASGTWTETTGLSFTPSVDLGEGSHRLVVQERDEAGNWSVDAFFDIFVDVTPPTAPAAGTAITRSMDASCAYTLTAEDIQAMAAGAFDAGGIDWAETLASADVTHFNWQNLDTPVTVTFQVTDLLGNDAANTTAAQVTVQDTTAPTAICKNITLPLDADGHATLFVGDVDNGSSDGCGVITTSVEPSAFTCANTGPNVVVLRVEDNHGNVSTCEAIVMVTDPLHVCKTFTVTANGPLEVHKAVNAQYTFSVSVSGTDGPVTYAWEFQASIEKGFVPLLDGEAIHGSGTNSLTLRPIAAIHQGEYRCVVSDGFNTAQSPVFTLYVLEGAPAGGLAALAALTALLGAAGAGLARRKR